MRLDISRARVRASSAMSIELAQDESVPGVAGFRFAGIAAGIKKNGNPDLGLVVADDGPVAAAAVLTKNRVRAAPVEITRERLAKSRGRISAILVNSGNANACTGAEGHAHALRACAAVASALDVDARAIVPASTGVIGAILPGDKIEAAAPALVRALAANGSADFARAIMTTDQWRKVAVARFEVGKKTVTVLGIAKGAGMIHPDMATTLGFVFTDAKASPAELRRTLKSATDATFNTISVDGDTSTNDTIVLAASGASGAHDAKKLERAVTDVLGALAESIVRDGEGAKHVVRIEVTGLPTDADARRAARTIATSPLVKTAIHGRDANWGRILAAAGRSGARFDPARAAIAIGGERIVERGMPVGKEAEARAAAVMAGPRYVVSVSLGRGRGKAHYLTCDLGPDYVAVNANYRS
jgi:glutamate N-acetyltransferase/amino-acid N-acetyltransferase